MSQIMLCRIHVTDICILAFFLIARGRELQVKVTICIQTIQFLISCLKRRNSLSNNSERAIGYITREKHKAQNSV